MVKAITLGVTVSVETNYQADFSDPANGRFLFAYQITIENLSSDVVQLQTRHWDIFDSLYDIETVDGDGVVGQTPIIVPGEKYVYSSGCMLKSTIGAMSGFYTMANFSNNTFLSFRKS